MPAIELLARAAAAGELILLVVLLAPAARRERVYLAATLLLLCVLGYLLAPIAVDHGASGWLTYPVVLMAVLVPPAFWFFTCCVFQDDFALEPYVPWLAAATTALALYSFASASSDTGGAIGWLAQGAKLAWVVAAFATLIRDWRGDLVTPRRHLRLGIVVVAGVYIVVILLVELVLTGAAPMPLEVLNTALIFVAITVLSVHLLTVDGSNVFNRLTDSCAPTDESLSELAQQVQDAMSNRRYASEGLTIEVLATELGTQAHRLRKVINGELGYRNFNTFINSYRVREVAKRMGQPEFRDTPLLTLALDAGFRSLAPFNRSFKEHYHLTPSSYRDQVAGK